MAIPSWAGVIDALQTVGGVMFVTGMGSVIIAGIWQLWALWRDRE